MLKLQLHKWLYKFLHGHDEELPGIPIKNPDESGNQRADQRNSLPDILENSNSTGGDANSLGNNLLINETPLKIKQDDQSTARTMVLEAGRDTSVNTTNNLLYSQTIILKTKTMNIFQKLGAIEHKVLTWVRAAIIPVNAFVNNLKTIEQTPQIQSLEQVLFPALDGFFPAAHIPALIAYVPAAMKALGWVTNEAAKTDKQVLDEGLAALKAKLLANPEVYALWLHNLNVMVSVKSSKLSGVDMPVQEAIKSVPLVYESEKQTASSVAPVSAPTASPLQPVYKPLDIPQQLNPVDQKAFDTVSVDAQGEKINTFTNNPL